MSQSYFTRYMKQSVITVFFCIMALFAIGQAQISVSKTFPVTDAQHRFYFQDDNSIVTVKFRKQLLRVSKFDKNSLRQLVVKDYAGLPKGCEFENIIELKGKVYLFYSRYDLPTQNELLFVIAFDMKTCNLLGKEKLIIEKKKKFAVYHSSFGYLTKSETKTKYYFYTSYDDEHLLISYILYPKAVLAYHEVVGLNIYDSTFNLKSEVEVTMPHVTGKSENLDFAIDADANTYMVTRVHNGSSLEGDKIEKEKTPDYTI